jgi:hypothetical protein
MLTFDEAAHKYFWNGKPVPGVTSILQALHSFDGVPAGVLEAAQDRGTAVHLCCEYLDKGILDEDSIDPAIAGYVDAWRLFTAEMRPEWSHIEAQCFHQAMRYAGTVDRVGVLNGKRYVLDIKTSVASHPVWGVQTAAYAHALGEQTASRATVQLRKDGTYRLLEWSDAADWPTFASLITINNFLQTHG